MNIITKSDIKKFTRLLKAGLKKGTRKEMKNYSSATMLDGTDVVTGYYVSLEFSFMVDASEIDDILNEDMLDNEIDELLTNHQ